MGREIWRQERAELEAVLADIEAGKIKLDRGMDDYLASLKRRIASLDEKLAKAD